MNNWKRTGKLSKHHLTPRSRGGKSNPENLIMLEICRHRAWHFLFNNRTIDEVIQLLKRVKKCQKGRRKK